MGEGEGVEGARASDYFFTKDAKLELKKMFVFFLMLGGGGGGAWGGEGRGAGVS